MRKVLGLNPITATFFLIIASVIVGALFVGWQAGWFKAVARDVSLLVHADIAVSRDVEQVVITLKNTGNVKVKILEVELEADKGFNASTSLETYPENLTVKVEGKFIKLLGGLELDPGDRVSISLRVYGMAWTVGRKYLVSVEYEDELGNKLVEVESFVP